MKDLNIVQLKVWANLVFHMMWKKEQSSVSKNLVMKLVTKQKLNQHIFKRAYSNNLAGCFYDNLDHQSISFN